MQSDVVAGSDVARASSPDGPSAPKNKLLVAREPTVRHFTGTRMNGPLRCAWSLNVAHYVITLFLSAWVMLKASSEADVIYRREHVVTE